MLPELARRGIAALGMKPFGGEGHMLKKGVVSATDALRYAMSLDAEGPVGREQHGYPSEDVLGG